MRVTALAFPVYQDSRPSAESPTPAGRYKGRKKCLAYWKDFRSFYHARYIRLAGIAERVMFPSMALQVLSCCIHMLGASPYTPNEIYSQSQPQASLSSATAYPAGLLAPSSRRGPLSLTLGRAYAWFSPSLTLGYLYFHVRLMSVRCTCSLLTSCLAGISIFGIGLESDESSCEAAIILCIAFYGTSKMLIYLFLSEYSHIFCYIPRGDSFASQSRRSMSSGARRSRDSSPWST